MDQIRRACGGKRWDIHRETDTGKDPSFTKLEFVGDGHSEARFFLEEVSETGKPVGLRQDVRAMWGELQSHASFPEATTTVEVASSKVPAGTFEGWLYTCVEGPETHRLWFSKDRPGPPVRHEIEIDGKLTYVSELYAGSGL